MPRRGSASATPSRVSLSSADAYVPPPPKGPSPFPRERPRATPSREARTVSPTALPDELAAFTPLPYRDVPTTRGRRVTVAAAEQAKLRMLATAPGAARAEAVPVPVPEPEEPDLEPDPDPEPLDEEPEPAAVAAPAPMPTPIPTPVAPPAPLVATPATIGDIDRLWDWIRGDGDGGASFFSYVVTSSVMLHRTFAALERSEQDAAPIHARIRALTCGDHHVGFAMLLPVLREERAALMHIYLRPEVRGMLATLLPLLVDLAAAAVPGYTLAVIGHDAALTRLHRTLLAPIGFVEHTMFLRPG